MRPTLPVVGFFIRIQKACPICSDLGCVDFCTCLSFPHWVKSHLRRCSSSETSTFSFILGIVGVFALLVWKPKAEPVLDPLLHTYIDCDCFVAICHSEHNPRRGNEMSFFPQLSGILRCSIVIKQSNNSTIQANVVINWSLRWRRELFCWTPGKDSAHTKCLIVASHTLRKLTFAHSAFLLLLSLLLYFVHKFHLSVVVVVVVVVAISKAWQKNTSLLCCCCPSLGTHLFLPEWNCSAENRSSGVSPGMIGCKI